MASWCRRGRKHERRGGFANSVRPIRDIGTRCAYLLGGGGLGNRKTDAEDGIGAQLGLVGGAVELDQELVDLWLVLDVDVLLDEGRADDLIDVGDGLGDTLSSPLGLVSIAELNGLVLTWSRTKSVLAELYQEGICGPVEAPEGTMAR